MGSLQHSRVGSGPPLLLIHGIGSWGRCWDPVVPLLAPHRHVITVDLPGFGGTPMKPGQDMTAAGLARTVADFLREIGVERPHVAGNSLGGWVGLELARAGAVASVTGLSPAGLWRSAPRYMRMQVRMLRQAPLALGDRGVRAVAAVAPLRYAAIANVFGRPWKLSRAEGLAQVQAVRACAGFESVLYAGEHRRFTGGMAIDVPVTITFGGRDLIFFGPACRLREELPAQTRWISPPRGWGHLPTWDDPRGVADLLLAGSASAVPAVRLRDAAAG